MFFSVGEAATSKWTHGEVAVFGSTVYKIFALKCQKLRTPLASLAPCVKIFALKCQKLRTPLASLAPCVKMAYEDPAKRTAVART